MEKIKENFLFPLPRSLRGRMNKKPRRKSPKKIKSFSTLNDDTIKYLTDLHDLFRLELDKQERSVDSLDVVSSGTTTEDGEGEDFENKLSLLKKRFLREISGKELSCLCDIRAANIWETVIPHLNLKDFCALLSRHCFTSSENIHSILFNKVGSRSLEQLITHCVFLCHLEDSVQSEKLVGLEMFWKGLVTSICKKEWLFAVLCDCNASHVVRSFLLGAVGFMKEGSVVTETEILRGAERLQNPNPFFISLVEYFWNAIENVCRKITHMKYLSHVHASLVLQALLFTKIALPMRQSAFFNHLFRLFKGKNFQKFSCNAVTSHLVEAFIYCMDNDSFQKLFDDHLRTEIPQLMHDKYGNHVLQQIIRKQKVIPKVLDIFDKLESQIDALVSMGHLGVLVALAEALIPCEVATQKSYVRKVAKALNCIGKTSYDLVRKLLYPSDAVRSAFMQVAESLTGNFDISQSSSWYEMLQNVPKCSPLGSVLVQCLVKYAAPARQLVEESLVSFEKSQLLLIALDPCGSRAVESFLSSCDNFSLLSRFIERFAGFYSILARDCYGFHVLLKMFAVSDLKGKRKLVEELAATRLWLASFPYGNQALARLKVNEFVRRQEQWDRKETTMENRKRLFKDLLEDESLEVVGPPTSKLNGQTKIKREVPNDNERQGEDAAQMEFILNCIKNVSK